MEEAVACDNVLEEEDDPTIFQEQEHELSQGQQSQDGQDSYFLSQSSEASSQGGETLHLILKVSIKVCFL